MANSFAPLDVPGTGTNAPSTNTKKVAYFYDSDVGNYAYNAGHPMKPHRIRMAHSLIMNYGLYKHLEIYRAKPASKYEMTQFHTDEYVDFLQKVTPDNMESFARECGKYNVGDDCPVFDGLFEFCGISAGGSMEGAARLNRGKCDVAVNWAGGLHHAKKAEASGFCYINDIVLGIIELLRYHARVLYIDIDVHHGDGVEEAFYTTNRVMTCSFHKYGEYFPGTGELRDIGVNSGKYHAINFPLRDGIDDKTYKSIFEPVISQIMHHYQPSAVVLQCGGDSLSGDRLGCFNLSMRGHANCVNFVKSFSLPTLVLGGGGYTMRNVARTWAFETGQLVSQDMPAELPFTDYYEYYSPDFELDVRASNMDNANSREYLDRIKAQVYDNLRHTAQSSGSVQMTDVPRSPLGALPEEELDRLDDEEADADAGKDRRYTERAWERKVERPGELYEDSDDEELAQRHGVRRQPARKRIGIMDYVNPHAPPGDSGANSPFDEAGSVDDGDVEDEDEAFDADAMVLDGADAAEIRHVNAEIAEDLLAMKAAKSESPEQSRAGPEGVASDESDAGAEEADDEMDIEGEEEVEAEAEIEAGTAASDVAITNAAAAQVDTPPDSPLPAATQTTAGVAEMSSSAGMERHAEDANAEAGTEADGGGHNRDGPPAT